MNKKEPTFVDLLLEAHIGLKRQGPGSYEAMKKAISFLPEPETIKKIADLGCGTGSQTIMLAKHFSGEITGLDLFPDFVEKLNKKAKKYNIDDRVTGVAGNMEDLPFEKNSFDLIWSEGAIDNIGFENGMRYWRDFLKKGGYVAVTCPTWLTEEHPEEVERFWKEAGSNVDTAESNIAIMQNAGYKFISAFALDGNCWTENYFIPRKKAIDRLCKKYGDCQTMKEYAGINEKEVELYEKYGEHYGYVFYIGKAI